MSGLIRGMEKEIIKVNYHTFVQQVTEHIMHSALESGGCSGQTKRHNMALIQAIPCNKSILSLMHAGCCPA
eukprot:1158916-Pelagomonas_calceolata.AAC.1